MSSETVRLVSEDEAWWVRASNRHAIRGQNEPNQLALLWARSAATIARAIRARGESK